MQLVLIPASGELPEMAASVPDEVRAIAAELAKAYANTGFVPPWVGYVAVVDEGVVGLCGFKGPPAPSDPAPDDDVQRVEIAYFTLPPHEGRGHATAMADELIRLARREDPSVAQTLREEGPSTSILAKHGFQRHAELIHPEDGEVWEWRLPNV